MGASTTLLEKCGLILVKFFFWVVKNNIVWKSLAAAGKIRTKTLRLPSPDKSSCSKICLESIQSSFVQHQLSVQRISEDNWIEKT